MTVLEGGGGGLLYFEQLYSSSCGSYFFALPELTTALEGISLTDV